MKTRWVFKKQQRARIILPYLLFISSFLVGCTPLIRMEQPAIVDWSALSVEQTIGQTFVAEYDGLSGIYFYLSPLENGNGEIRLHLRSAPKDGSDLAVSSNTWAVDAIKTPGFYGFFVPAQALSNQKYYYACLELAGGGDVQVATTAIDAYMNGSIYQNGSPEDGQAAFKLSYSRRKAFLGLGLEAISWAGILAAGIFLFILPGWGIISLLWSGWGKMKWPEKVGLSASLSLALYPILFLWTDIIGLHMGALYAWFPPLAGLGIIVWLNRNKINIRKLLQVEIFQFSLPDGIFIGLLVLIIFTRFWAIRSLGVPLWGDSYQHTMMAQLLVDNGGLFSSWFPYAELQTFTYHFGFHTAVAAFHWISGFELPQSTLWAGQIINILAIVALYPLASRVGKNRWGGVGAVLVAGLLSPMPMYYTNWGRYTQLAGQVILPGVIYLIWTALESKKRDWSLTALVWIGLAGLALTHYLVTIFAGLFIIAIFVLRDKREKLSASIVNISLLFSGALILFLPWFIHIFLGKLPNILNYYVTAPTKAATTFLQQFNAIGDISIYLPLTLWLIMGICVAWGVWRHEKSVLLIGLWWFLNLLATNPQWLGLPGEGVITNFTLFIAVYIPAGVLVGAGIGWLQSYFEGEFFLKNNSAKKWFYFVLIVILFTGSGIWGIGQRLGDMNIKSSALVTRPDINASEWIQKNTPQNAVFLVNSFFAYGDSLIVGSDGGWWLPLLAKRQTTLPPLTYGSEQGSRPDYIAWINMLTSEIQVKGITNPDTLSLLHERGVRYVYIGQRQGRTNYYGLYVIKPDDLLSSPTFQLLYHQDGVWIFEVIG
jgi:hypothetical protein